MSRNILERRPWVRVITDRNGAASLPGFMDNAFRSSLIFYVKSEEPIYARERLSSSGRIAARPVAAINKFCDAMVDIDRLRHPAALQPEAERICGPVEIFLSRLLKALKISLRDVISGIFVRKQKVNLGRIVALRGGW